MTERITDLESRLAFQEDALTALNSTVARQDREITELRMAIQQLASALRGLHLGGAGRPEDEIPPHY